MTSVLILTDALKDSGKKWALAVGDPSGIRGRTSAKSAATAFIASTICSSSLLCISAGARPCAGPGDLPLNQVSFLFWKASESGSGRNWGYVSRGLPVCYHPRQDYLQTLPFRNNPSLKQSVLGFCILLISSISKLELFIFLLCLGQGYLFKLNLSSTIYYCLHFIKERAFLSVVLLRYDWHAA